MASKDALKATKKQLNRQKKMMAKSAKGKKKTDQAIEERTTRD